MNSSLQAGPLRRVASSHSGSWVRTTVVPTAATGRPYCAALPPPAPRTPAPRRIPMHGVVFHAGGANGHRVACTHMQRHPRHDHSPLLNRCSRRGLKCRRRRSRESRGTLRGIVRRRLRQLRGDVGGSGKELSVDTTGVCRSRRLLHHPLLSDRQSFLVLGNSQVVRIFLNLERVAVHPRAARSWLVKRRAEHAPAELGQLLRRPFSASKPRSPSAGQQPEGEVTRELRKPSFDPVVSEDVYVVAIAIVRTPQDFPLFLQDRTIPSSSS